MNMLKDHKHYIIYGLLIIGIIWAICRDKEGRYELGVGGESTFVLDTRTSQLWLRVRGASVYLGTNQNPKFEKIDRD